MSAVTVGDGNAGVGGWRYEICERGVILSVSLDVVLRVGA